MEKHSNYETLEQQLQSQIALKNQSKKSNKGLQDVFDKIKDFQPEDTQTIKTTPFADRAKLDD